MKKKKNTKEKIQGGVGVKKCKDKGLWELVEGGKERKRKEMRRCERMDGVVERRKESGTDQGKE